jgi:hypothetical protein
MKTSPTFGVIAAVAASLVIAGCYTQFGSTEEEQPPDDVTYSEPDSLGGGVVSAEAYEDARYRFYVNVGYPYWATSFSVGFWDPYPFDPWLWGPPAYWYPYGAYYSPGWYYPPAAYYPPAYWYGEPGVPYPGGYAAYTNRTFGTTRGHGSAPTGGGAYQTSPAGLGGRSASTLGVRPASTRLGRPTPTPAVNGRRTTTPSAVDRPTSTSPASRQGRTGTRGTTPKVRPAPEQRQPQGSGSRQSVTPQRAPERKSDDSYARPRSGDSGGSRSYTPPPSYTPPSRSSGSEPRGGSSGGGSSSPRSGGRH